jgi:UDP-glucose 4-epimerase
LGLTILELLNANLEVAGFDNFCSSHPEALLREARINNKQPTQVQGDSRNIA